mmetsp:Transcript_16171/g.41308  ORF Transcript_16171/g.41308 Transcript_16171/m.41308 type:complete len:202 (-) Transcript_16171:42-647(-)
MLSPFSFAILVTVSITSCCVRPFHCVFSRAGPSSRSSAASTSLSPPPSPSISARVGSTSSMSAACGVLPLDAFKCGKKKPISRTALASLSEPWSAFLVLSVPYFARKLAGSTVLATSASVGPIASRQATIASCFSSTAARIRPLLTNSIRSSKKGLCHGQQYTRPRKRFEVAQAKCGCLMQGLASIHESGCGNSMQLECSG